MEVIFNTIKVYQSEQVKKDGIILSGNDHFIGSDEKRRNTEIIHIELPFTFGNYALFYKGNNDILKRAVACISLLLNSNKKTSEQTKCQLYGELINCLHIVHHIDGNGRNSKLAGINSLSTACLDNLYCLERIKNNDSICSHCYAATQQKQQLALQDRNTINGIILRNILIPAKYWKKYINPADMSKFFRIESFGDVQNKLQAQNYIEFMKAFPRIHFAAWSKNNGIWYFAFAESGKPANLSYIASSNKLNTCELYCMKTYGFIDHVFTVYDKETIKKDNITINCGGRKCMNCIKHKENCYFANTEAIINEQKK